MFIYFEYIWYPYSMIFHRTKTGWSIIIVIMKLYKPAQDKFPWNEKAGMELNSHLYIILLSKLSFLL